LSAFGWHRTCERSGAAAFFLNRDRSQPNPAMNKSLSLAFLVVGVVLLVFGLNSADSVASSVSEAVTGTPTDKSMWLIVLGAVGIVAGGVGFFAGRKG
jgi:hypothetical protein